MVSNTRVEVNDVSLRKDKNMNEKTRQLVRRLAEEKDNMDKAKGAEAKARVAKRLHRIRRLLGIVA